MPYYVVDTMGHIPGLSGLFVAGIFSASLSTVSASLNSLAAVTIEDYYKPLYKHYFKKNLTNDQASTHSKIIAFIYGIVCLIIAFIAQFLGGVLQAALTIFGVVGGPLLGLFSLGMFTTTANQKGAVAGLLCGLGMAMWMAFGGPRPPTKGLPRITDGCDPPVNATRLLYTRSDTDDRCLFINKTYLFCLKFLFCRFSEYFWLYRVSYLYNGVLGLLVTFIFGYLFSFVLEKCFGETQDELDPNLFVPPLSKRLKNQKEKMVKLMNMNGNGSNEDLQNGTRF